MTKDQVIQPGNYFYSRPGWDKEVLVTVLVPDETCHDPRDEPLFVRFTTGYYPTRWSNIPADAVFREGGPGVPIQPRFCGLCGHGMRAWTTTNNRVETARCPSCEQNDQPRFNVITGKPLTSEEINWLFNTQLLYRLFLERAPYPSKKSQAWESLPGIISVQTENGPVGIRQSGNGAEIFVPEREESAALVDLFYLGKDGQKESNGKAGCPQIVIDDVASPDQVGYAIYKPGHTEVEFEHGVERRPDGRWRYPDSEKASPPDKV